MRRFLACLALILALSVPAPVSANEEALKAGRQFDIARDYERAIISYSEAIDSATLSKNSLVTALNWRARVYEILEQFSKARADLLRLVETNPSLPSSHYALAEFLARRGDLATARQSYEKALELSPRYGQAYSGLGYIRLRREEWADALDLIDKAITYQGDSAATWFNRGVVLDRLGRRDEAIASFRIAEVLAADPTRMQAELARLGAE